ncbi:hypothetical protein, partial [Microcoleus sp. herbarium14]|uniref:hypothetical protein n=1 Tax=Microcoleus sp. herbarium14 TaxID=3055439 RepID=UPI002FD745C2
CTSIRLNVTNCRPIARDRAALCVENTYTYHLFLTSPRPIRFPLESVTWAIDRRCEVAFVDAGGAGLF